MLDPYFAELRQKIFAQRAGSPPPDLAAMRAATAKETEALGAGPALDRVEDLKIKTRSGDINLRLFTDQNPQAVVVFVHGGGWVLGSLDDFDSLARAFAKESGSLVVSPDYRLAPENPYPCGLEDVEDALLWAAEFARSQNLPLIAMGDSAGANLALGAVLELGESLTLDHFIALYPVVDSDFDKSSYRLNGEGQLFTTAAMKRFFESYAPRDIWNDPKISVLRHHNLRLLPETTVLSCGCDLLRDDAIRLRDAVKALGGEVRHLAYESAPHAFLRHYQQSALAKNAVLDISARIKAAALQGGTQSQDRVVARPL